GWQARHDLVFTPDGAGTAVARRHVVRRIGATHERNGRGEESPERARRSGRAHSDSSTVREGASVHKVIDARNRAATMRERLWHRGRSGPADFNLTVLA